MSNTVPRDKQACQNCNAFATNPAVNPRSGQPRQGICRAHSPRAFPVMMPGSPLHPGGPQMQQGIQGVFPPVTDELWCREWGPREE